MCSRVQVCEAQLCDLGSVLLRKIAVELGKKVYKIKLLETGKIETERSEIVVLVIVTQRLNRRILT